MNYSVKKTLIWVTIFSIAMGMLESAVVIYLRELYYPNGFDFPLTPMNGIVALTEILREAATLVMLLSVGILQGRTNTEKFAYFIYSFAVWDLFYYVFLKVLIKWPESFFTWDILFLLPTTWVGPVFTPVLLSVAMICLALAIVYFTSNHEKCMISTAEWGLFIGGSLVCIVAFTFEYVGFLLQEFSFIEAFTPSESLMNYAIGFVPESFPWGIFILGFLLIATGIALFITRNSKLK